MSIWATTLLAIVVRCIFCGIFLFFPTWLCCPQIPKLPTDPPMRGFPTVWKPPSRLPPQDGSLSLTLFSLFVFYILSFLILKRMCALSGCLTPSGAFRSCFVEVAQHSNDLLMNLWGESGLPVLFLCHLGTALNQILKEAVIS